MRVLAGNDTVIFTVPLMTDSPTNPDFVDDLAPLARAIGRPAFAALKALALGADSESVQLSALKEIFERGYGRTSVPHLPVSDAVNPLPIEAPRWARHKSEAIPDPADSQ